MGRSSFQLKNDVLYRNDTKMTTIAIGKFQKWTPLLHVFVLMLGTLLSFITAYFRGEVSLYLPFISETGAYTPAKCIFSLFLILGSFIGCVMVFFNFVTICMSHGNQIRNFHCVNFFTFLIGIKAMLGLAGVAAFPMTTVFWAHLVAASIYFAGSAIYFICITYITTKLEGKSHILYIRYALCVAIVVLLMLLGICFPISLKRWQENNEVIPALKEPKDEGFTLILISSIIEWAIVTIIIIFNVTFIKEMKASKVLIVVCPEAPRRDPIADDFPCASPDSPPRAPSSV